MKIDFVLVPVKDIVSSDKTKQNRDITYPAPLGKLRYYTWDMLTQQG